MQWKGCAARSHGRREARTRRRTRSGCGWPAPGRPSHRRTARGPGSRPSRGVEQRGGVRREVGHGVRPWWDARASEATLVVGEHLEGRQGPSASPGLWSRSPPVPRCSQSPTSAGELVVERDAMARSVDSSRTTEAPVDRSRAPGRLCATGRVGRGSPRTVIRTVYGFWRMLPPGASPRRLTSQTRAPRPLRWGSAHCQLPGHEWRRETAAVPMSQRSTAEAHERPSAMAQTIRLYPVLVPAHEIP